MTTFTISDGENYWSKFEKFIQLYNNLEIRTEDIPQILGITKNKYRQYLQRATEENRLEVIVVKGSGRRRRHPQ